VTQSSTSISDTVVAYTVEAASTATAGADYSALSGTVTIPAGSTSATIDVTGIVADSLVEGDEDVQITLGSITAGDPGITLDAANDNAAINILDSDTAEVSIAATTDGNEAGPIDGVFTVTQSNVSTSDTQLSYNVAGTATSGSDYTPLTGTVTILAGDTSTPIIVPVVDDGISEPAETVIVTLTGVTAGAAGVSVAASPDDSATLSILDNDANLITTKTVNNPTPLEGDTVVYTITVSNGASAPVTNVSLTDVLPAGVTYVGDDSAGAYDNTTGVWNIGNLGIAAPNDVATLNITATVDAGASSLAQPIVNTTTAATGDLSDGDTLGDVLTAGITVDNNADLITTKVVDNPSPIETGTIIYTLAVVNNGAARATNVSLTDVLPAGISYVSDDSSGTYDAVTGQWAIGTLENGETATLNLTATVNIGAGALAQPISNVTTAAIGDQPDPDTTTDDLSEDVTVNYNADLVTAKTVDNSAPSIGDSVVYALTVTNNGPAPATNVSLTDLLPTGVSYVSDDSAGAYDSGTGLWTVGDLANGEVATLSITALVTVDAISQPQPITNTATAATSDQVDPDITTDDLSEDIFVTVVDPDLIQLVKAVGSDRAVPGGIVSYSIEIRNNTAFPINGTFINDTPARGFKYMAGTAMLDGVPISDPSRGLPLVFDVGTLPGHVDANGNGIADLGEAGYRVLSYRMVAGSGVTPGVWSNSAVTTLDCEDCVVSNTATADIEIVQDTLFDLGTIIGKVFYDANEDGWQDPGEAGIAAAMVALDDGTYVLTDAFGRYHFPAVKPGQRLLKINLHSLAGAAVATNDKTRILNVTPGLLAKANFGVKMETVDAAIGADGLIGVNVDSETTLPPILINGSTAVPTLLVNGEPAFIATADVILGTAKLQDVVELQGSALAAPIRFTTDVDDQLDVESWQLQVVNSQDETIFARDGSGNPPEVIEWDGIRDNGKLISGGEVYTYQLTLSSADGHALSSSKRLFGVNRRNSVSLNLAGGAFITGSHELTVRAKALLADTAEAIRAYPNETIVISGHTDSVGTDQSNAALSERRARSAFNYLTAVENIPAERFVVEAYGESRPIADNDTAWGRELNRRVEISGDLSKMDLAKNYDPYRQPPGVRINGKDFGVDDNGRFAGELASDQVNDSMRVLLGTSQGRTVETIVPLPTIEVLSPSGAFAIAFDNDVSEDGGRLTTELAAQTEPGNTIELDGEPLEVDSEGRFSADITVRPGENYYGLVARNPMGMLRIANLRLLV
ncbi:MAG: OmpA family protein, partial [Woeseiaceae bacterium]